MNLESEIYQILRKHKLSLNKREELIVDLLDFINKRDEAINYSQCCETLPTEKEMTLEKRKTFKRINDGITTIDKFSYGLGFRKCFSWLAKDTDY